METWTEGLKVYRVIPEVRNTYFLDVEYHILRSNAIPEMLSVQIRDQDGECSLLYEITGMRCLKDLGDEHVLTFQEYYTFLEDCGCLMEALDKYMLAIDQVSFDPGDIFQEQNGHVRWIYSPKTQEDIAGKVTRLFEWLLSMIDYGDMKTVQFAYHAYWCIRKHTFSKQVIRECLDYSEKEIAHYTSDSYDDFFKTELPPVIHTEPVEAYRNVSDSSGMSIETNQKEEYPPANSNNAKVHEQKGNLFLAVEIFCIITAIILIVALIVFLIIGILQGMIKEMKYIYFSLIIVVLILCDCIWQMHKNRKILSEENHSVITPKEIPAPSYNYSWDQEGGTEVLGIRRDMLQPALKDEESGKVCVIEEFPFYIGSNRDMNQLVIADSAVSRQHAVIVRGRQTGYYDLQDLRSTNGTWLNQSALVYEKPVRLNPGDRIRFASKTFMFIMLDCPMGEYDGLQEKH